MHKVTRLRPTMKINDYSGKPEIDWSKPEELEMECVVSETLQGEEDSVGVIQLTDSAKLLFPGQIGLDIKATDRFRYRNNTYNVKGTPKERISPLTGTVGGTVVKLELMA